MKDLKEYIRESRSILADIDDQLESGDKALKSVIINWLKDNVKSIEENELKFDFSTAPITVNYDGNIVFKANITSLTNGMFQWGEVGGRFSCSSCKSLKSLEGAPNKVGDYFICAYCKSLKSLEGAPKEVRGDFNCISCEKLKSLEGAPNKVGDYFICAYCKSLKSLEGAPKEVGGGFYCNDCGMKFTEDDVRHASKVQGKIYC